MNVDPVEQLSDSDHHYVTRMKALRLESFMPFSGRTSLKGYSEYLGALVNSNCRIPACRNTLEGCLGSIRLPRLDRKSLGYCMLLAL